MIIAHHNVMSSSPEHTCASFTKRPSVVAESASKKILPLHYLLELQEYSKEMDLTFEKFSEGFKNDFVNLNLAWLKESFAVEPHDVAVLERCEVRSEFQGYFVGIFVL